MNQYEIKCEKCGSIKSNIYAREDRTYIIVCKACKFPIKLTEKEFYERLKR